MCQNSDGVVRTLSGHTVKHHTDSEMEAARWRADRAQWQLTGLCIGGPLPWMLLAAAQQ